MRKNIFVLLCIVMAALGTSAKGQTLLEVTGTATNYIMPDRITVEIGMEEYYKHKTFGDSTIVKLSEIEKKVRKTLAEAGVPDSQIKVTDVGNYRNPYRTVNFLMAKRISATVTDFEQIDRISDNLDRRGITSFNIVNIDNSEIEKYNREGIVAALNAAREKGDALAENLNAVIMSATAIQETGTTPRETTCFSNVSYDSGSGMDGIRRIVRNYSVKVTYYLQLKNQ